MCPKQQRRDLCLSVKVKLWFVSFPCIDCKSFSALMQFLFQHLFPKMEQHISISMDRAQQLPFSVTLPNYTTKESHGDVPLQLESKANACHRKKEILPIYAKCAQHRRKEVKWFRNAKPNSLAHLCILSETPCP